MRADLVSAPPSLPSPLPTPGGNSRATRGAERNGARGRVVVIDADRRAASGTAAWLCTQGWHASAAGSADEARRLVSRGRCDAWVVVGQVAMRGAEAVRQQLPSRHALARLVAVLPSQADPAGWDITIGFPAADDRLLEALTKACPIPSPDVEPGLASPADRVAILGGDPAIRRVLDIAGRVADTGVTILLTGESGTGKSLLAREIHAISGRRSGRFVEVACGSLSESLLESELFGHVAGAFTGATVDREGRFAQADGGTIFLDEIATATPGLQVKLLRVLQNLEFEPVGGGSTRKVDARLVLATHEDLAALVAAGRFRADLFWRINVVTIEMPALRDRRSDIPLLASHFLTRAAARAGRTVDGFTPGALAALLAHDWPGNVRELEHAVERGVYLGTTSRVEVGDLPPAVMAAGAVRVEPLGAGALRESLAVPERQMILEALQRHAWRRDAAARALGINRTTLYKKAKRLGLDLSALPAGG
ncbi:MAG: sigma-54 dependent transcriptional regulator [Planctomycetia bacterium]